MKDPRQLIPCRHRQLMLKATTTYTGSLACRHHSGGSQRRGRRRIHEAAIALDAMTATAVGALRILIGGNA
jgi:hypothetical protein